jgi:hypothetical protein
MDKIKEEFKKYIMKDLDLFLDACLKRFKNRNKKKNFKEVIEKHKKLVKKKKQKTLRECVEK